MTISKDIPVLGRIIELAYAMLLVILLSAIVGLILAFPVMWLWNYVFGSMLTLNVFQAWALNVLAGILLGKTANTRK